MTGFKKITGLLDENRFQCAICKGTFERALTDEEVEAQFEREFPAHSKAEACGVCCDDCFQRFFGARA